LVTHSNDYAHRSNLNPAEALTLSTSFCAVRGWQTNEPTPFRSLTTVTSSHKAAIFVLLSDSGAISIWGIHGQCLGKLVDHLGPHLVPNQSNPAAISWRLSNRGLARADTTQELLCSGAMARMRMSSAALSPDPWSKERDPHGTRSRDQEAEQSASQDLPVVSVKARMRNAILSQLMSQ
jgi:hypothetical protein